MRSYCGTETDSSGGTQDGCFCCGMVWAGDWAAGDWDSRLCTAFGKSRPASAPDDEYCKFFPASHFGYTMCVPHSALRVALPLVSRSAKDLAPCAPRFTALMSSRYRCNGGPTCNPNAQSTLFAIPIASSGTACGNLTRNCHEDKRPPAGLGFTTQAASACNTEHMASIKDRVFEGSWSDLRSGVRDPCAELCLYMGAYKCSYLQNDPTGLFNLG